MAPVILITLVIIVVVLLVVISAQPGDFRIERSVTVAAPPSNVFPEVSDLHKWDAWSPWEKLDPNTKKTYGGAYSGVGATYHWLGNAKVGEGRMEITESRPDEFIKIRLQFLKPMAATHTTEFTFKRQGEQTLVTQSMYGKNGFMGKAMGLFMSMDTMIGTMFEQGLASLKSVAES